MLLFSMMNLNVSGVFVYLSYSPLFFMYFVFCGFTFFGLSLWTYTFDMYSMSLLIFILVFSMSFLSMDMLTDTLYGINEVTTLHSIIQYCFMWFMLSEAALFFSFFWAAFALNMLVTLEFNTIMGVFPMMYANNIMQQGFMFYWFYLDLFNIMMNTFFLFFSGIFCNYFYVLITYKSMYTSMMLCFLSLITGFLFMWNQLWEFTLITFTMSTNSFCSTLLAMDMLHFSHVSLGVFFMAISLIKMMNVNTATSKVLFFTCIVLYWHFVDLVWFLLLSFLYFSMLCVIFMY